MIWSIRLKEVWKTASKRPVEPVSIFSNSCSWKLVLFYWCLSTVFRTLYFLFWICLNDFRNQYIPFFIEQFSNRTWFSISLFSSKGSCSQIARPPNTTTKKLLTEMLIMEQSITGTVALREPRTSDFTIHPSLFWLQSSDWPRTPHELQAGCWGRCLVCCSYSW